MKLIKDSQFNSQEPFQNLLAPEFDTDTTNLLNTQAYASNIPEPTLPPLLVTDNNSPEDITSFSNSLTLSQKIPNTDFTPPHRK
jgi:hypothetical protein